MSISKFGGIQIKSILTDASGGTFYGEVSTINYAESSIPVYFNDEYIDSPGTHSMKNFGWNIVVSASSATTFTAALDSNLINGAKIGIFPSTSNSRLIFYVS